MPTAFGNIRPEEHQAVLDQVASLERTIEQLDQEKRWAQDQARRQGVIDDVAKMARQAVEKAESEGAEVDQLAAVVLAEQVADPIKQQRVEEIVERLKYEHVKLAQAEVNNPDWVASESERQDGMLRRSGAYGVIDETIQAEKVQEIILALKEARRLVVDKQLATPEAVAQATSEAEILAQPELDEYRQQKEAGFTHELREQAVRAGRQGIDEEFAAKLASELGPAIDRWRASNDGANYRTRKERAYREKRDEAAISGGQAQIDGELIARQAVYDTYLSEFESRGINLENIPKGTVVKLALGKIFRKDNPNYSYHNNRVPRYNYMLGTSKRIMTLESRGAGKFLVRYDSIEHEDNELLHDLSLNGKVISVGRHVDDQSNGETGIEHMISKGEKPCFDDDTTSPDIIIEGKLPIANISVAGVPAIGKYADVLKT